MHHVQSNFSLPLWYFVFVVHASIGVFVGLTYEGLRSGTTHWYNLTTLLCVDAQGTYQFLFLFLLTQQPPDDYQTGIIPLEQ